MIVIKCPSTVASGSSAWNPGFVDGRHDEGSHEPIPPIWTRSSCRHRWRPLMHAIQPLPLSRCWYNAICVDIHRLVWIGGWRDVPHIVNSIPSTPYFRDACTSTADYITLHHEKNKKWSYIPKRECKFLSHQATSRKKQKRSYTYSETRMQTSAAKPEKAFFWNFFGIHQDWNSKKIKHFAAKFFCKFFLHFFLEFIKI